MSAEYDNDIKKPLVMARQKKTNLNFLFGNICMREDDT
jgi:hypothetical protein